MAYNDRMITSLRGRRIGLQRLSSAISGGSRGSQEFLVGPEALRAGVTTAETTARNLHPFGVSMLPAGTSLVFTIDPPIPGVQKHISVSTAGPAYVKTANGETFVTTSGSSWTTIKFTSLGGGVALVGLTTAQWATAGLTSAANSLTTST